MLNLDKIMKLNFRRKFNFLIFWFIFLLFLVLIKTSLAATLNTYEDTEVPIILDRSLWENSAQLKGLLKIENPKYYSNNSNDTPNYYPISRIIVHDNACQIYLPDGSRNSNCNSYRQDVISLIQNIYRYHVLNKGYKDIGYHFIISWDGRIFEARYGGNSTVGDHFYQEDNCKNYNVGTSGILLLANLADEKSSQEMQESLARLVGWLAMANGLDPRNLEKVSFVWENFRETAGKKRECDLKRGNFGDYWKGPTILYYKDFDNQESNYALDIEALRIKANLFKGRFEKYLYKRQGDVLVWMINQGLRKIGTKIGARVIEINKNQLEYFPQEELDKVKENDLIKLQGQDDIYLLKDNFCYKVISRQIFEAWKFKEENIKEITLQALGNYSFGPVLPYPQGFLLREEGKKEVYLVDQSGRLSHISSLKLFEALGFDWGKVVVMSSREKNAFFEKEPTLFATGILIKGADKTVYLVSSGSRKPIRRLSLFQRHQFRWEDVIELPDEEVQLYSLGDLLDYPDGTLLSSDRNNQEVYFLRQGRRHLIANHNLVNLLGLKDFSAQISLPEEELLSYPLGIELRDEEDVERFNRLSQLSIGDFLKISENDNDFKEFLTIRIGLAELNFNDELAIKANKDYNVYEANLLKEKRIAESTYRLKIKDIKNKISFSSENGNGVFSLVDFPKAAFQDIGKRYRGSLEIVMYKPPNLADFKYWLVNKVVVEDYLRGIEQSQQESNLDFLKALGVANRSYAFHYKDRGGRYSQDKPFDLDRKEGNLLYRGEEAERFLPGLRAIEETQGEILAYKNEAARAVYSFDTCGCSQDARLVWGAFYKNFPYLWGDIKDPIGTSHGISCPVLIDHGVGMSLRGAQKLAQALKPYFQILEYYYPGTKLTKIY